jgi:succinate dehydrogenase / fumarate reductase flavoprotein subunit
MSESLRNDGRVWVPKKGGDTRPPAQIPIEERDYYLERIYPSFGNLAPRDIASRAAKRMCDEGRGVGATKMAVYLDFADAIKRLGEDTIRMRYGNLFDMYAKITAEDPYQAPMRIYPAVHYCMGGLWVDYNLMSTIPGLFVLGEANFSDHGANRLGASALMQGLADGYFVAPYSVGNYLGATKLPPVQEQQEAFQGTIAEVKSGIDKLVGVRGKEPVDELHRRLGKVMWELCGMARNEQGLKKAIEQVKTIREEFWHNVCIPGDTKSLTSELEKAGRVADFLELGELMCRDALERRESCGGHFREEMQTPDGEAKRDDEKFLHVAAWEFQGEGKPAVRHQEALEYENVHLAERSYK